MLFSNEFETQIWIKIYNEFSGSYAQLFTGTLKSCPQSKFIEITNEKTELSLEIYHQSGDALCEYLIYNPEGLKLYFTISGISEHYFEQAQDHGLWIYGKNPNVFESILSSSDKSVMTNINEQLTISIASQVFKHYSKCETRVIS